MSDKQKTIRKIIENYQHLEQSLVQQLLLEVNDHQPTTGSYREEVWKSLFEQIIPKKFCISQGVFIIDSEGNISKEVDLAIYDEQYTPYIFNYGKIKFIPIEAVAVVIQCKSSNWKADDLINWVDSIKNLRTSLQSIARIMGPSQLVDNTDNLHAKQSQSATRPINILCCIKRKVEENIINLFDITLHIGEDGNLKKVMPKEENTYNDWYKELNHYQNEKSNITKPILKKLTDLRITDDDTNVLLSLIFQLNQLLMIINNPMLFPHQSYADMFGDVLKESKRKER